MLYLHVFNWPNDGKLLVPINNTVRKAYLLAVPEKSLERVAGEGGVTLTLPATAPDLIDSVIAVVYQGDVQVLDGSVQQAVNGTITLTAADADVVGATARLEGDNPVNIGYWTDARDYLQWTVKVIKPGTFTAEITSACPNDVAGSAYTFAIGDQKIKGTVGATGDWRNYQTTRLDAIRIEKAGTLTMTLQPTNKPGMAVMNFRSLVLQPEAQ